MCVSVVAVNKPNTRPIVPEVLPLVRAIYAQHCAGCCLHILTDDGNVEDSDVAYCLQQARESKHADCIRAAELLMQMTHTQRRKIYRTH